VQAGGRDQRGIATSGPTDDRVDVQPAPPVEPRRGTRRCRSAAGQVSDHRTRVAWTMVAPAGLHALFWITLPVLATFVLSVTNLQRAGPAAVRRAGQLVKSFRDPIFPHLDLAHRLYAFFTVPVAMAIAVFLGCCSTSRSGPGLVPGGGLPAPGHRHGGGGHGLVPDLTTPTAGWPTSCSRSSASAGRPGSPTELRPVGR